jgi:hypothetical protein
MSRRPQIFDVCKAWRHAGAPHKGEGIAGVAIDAPSSTRTGATP